MKTDSDKIEAQIELLRKSYVLQLPDKLAQIEAAENIILFQDFNLELLNAAYKTIHSISGSVSMLGFNELGNSAYELELVLKSIINNGIKPVEKQITLLKLLFERIKASIISIGLDYNCKPIKESTTAQNILARKTARVLIMDSKLKSQSGGKLLESLYEAQFVDNFEELKSNLEKKQYDALIVNTDIAIKNKDFDAFIRHQKECNKVQLLIFTSETNCFDKKLWAINADADFFYAEPYEIIELISKIDKSTEDQNTSINKVLIISEQYSDNQIAISLQQEGIITESVSDSKLITRILSDMNPDLIIVNKNMPDCNSDQIIKIIHTENSLWNIPCLLILDDKNSSTSSIKHNTSYNSILNTQTSSEFLVSFVKTQIEKAKEAKSLSKRDVDTREFNLNVFKGKIISALARAEKRNTNLTLTIIRLFKDDLENTNLNPVELRLFIRLLKQFISPNDTIGSFGVQEIELLLPEKTAKEAETIISSAINAFYKFQPNSQIKVSYGNSSYPEFKSYPELIFNAVNMAKTGTKPKAEKSVNKVMPRILVADDELHIRELLEAQLTKFGYDVVGKAQNGEEAINLYKEHQPDILLLDINMPLKTGKEVLTEIRKEYPDAIIIILTSIVDFEMVKTLIKSRVNEFIRKDVPIEEINNIIFKCWKKTL